MRILGPSDARTMPWKNGGGVTTELLIRPTDATVVGGFDLRVSRASVATGGPFSAFPGCDRTLLLLEGPGLALDLGDHGRATLEAPFQTLAFSGDWAVEGALLGGPCVDFNVITRRAACQHRLAVHRGRSVLRRPAADLWLVFVARGTAEPLGGRSLVEGELLVAEGGDAPEVIPGAPETVLISVEVDGRLSASC